MTVAARTTLKASGMRHRSMQASAVAEIVAWCVTDRRLQASRASASCYSSAILLVRTQAIAQRPGSAGDRPDFESDLECAAHRPSSNQAWHPLILSLSPDYSFDRRYHLRTSGFAFPVVLERLSNTPARLQELPPRTPDLSRGRPWESNRWGDAHSGRPRCLVAMRLWHGTLLGVRYHLRTSGVAFPFVRERLSNTPARLYEPCLNENATIMELVLYACYCHRTRKRWSVL